MKLAAAALIGACAVYAISQAADRPLDRTSTENDPLRNKDNNKDDILRIFRNKKENFAESDVTYAVVIPITRSSLRTSMRRSSAASAAKHMIFRSTMISSPSWRRSILR